MVTAVTAAAISMTGRTLPYYRGSQSADLDQGVQRRLQRQLQIGRHEKKKRKTVKINEEKIRKKKVSEEWKRVGV